MFSPLIIRRKPRIFGRKSAIFHPGYTPGDFMCLLTQDGKLITTQGGKALLTQQRAS